MIFIGVDWAEVSHDVCVMDEPGRVLAARRVRHGVGGLAELHELVGEHAEDPAEVVVGIETDRGLLVHALVGAGYQLYAINPMAVARYRERHGVSGAKSDRGDAKVLADLVRTDRHNHRPIAGDSPLVEAVKVLARSHQSATWTRQRHLNSLRSALLEFYPAALEAFGTDLGSTDAIAVLSLAPTPERGRRLSRSKIAAAWGRAGRERNIEARAIEIHTALRSQQLTAPAPMEAAYGVVVGSTVALITAANQQIATLEAALDEGFSEHPDAKIIRSLPGLGTILGARVLGEFGDDRTRFATPKSRKNYAGSAPVTRASGKSLYVLARHARNRRLADALHRWAFCSITASPGARRYYDQLRARNKTHNNALRQLANRWVGILHTCLDRNVRHDEHAAWGHLTAITT